MSFHDSVAAIAAETEITQKTVRKVLSSLQAQIIIGLEKDGIFALPGIGNYKKVISKERIGINLQTKEKVKIPKRARVTFKAAKALKKDLKVPK